MICPDMEKRVIIASFNDLSMAYIARSKLESAEIPCFLANEHLVAVDRLYVNAVQGVNLTVWESDAAMAKELLAEDLSQEDIAPEDRECAPDLEKALFEPEFVCPRCGSDDIAKISLRRILLVTPLLLFLPPVVSRKAICRCRACSRIWRE